MLYYDLVLYSHFCEMQANLRFTVSKICRLLSIFWAVTWLVRPRFKIIFFANTQLLHCKVQWPFVTGSTVLKHASYILFNKYGYRQRYKPGLTYQFQNHIYRLQNFAQLRTCFSKYYKW